VSDVKLGDKVRFSHHLVRSYGKDRTWNRHSRSGEGVVVGTRTLQNGHVVYGTWDDPNYFVPEEPVPAVLVAFHLRKAPVYVPPEDVEKIDG
jgi:hypothetical protein